MVRPAAGATTAAGRADTALLTALGDGLGPLKVNGRLSGTAVFASRADARQALPYVRRFGRECLAVDPDDDDVALDLAGAGLAAGC